MSSAPTGGFTALDRRDLWAMRSARVSPRRLDADERDVVHAPGLLDDLVGDAGQRAIERDLVEDLRLVPIGHRGQKKEPARGWEESVGMTGTWADIVMALLAGLTGPA